MKANPESFVDPQPVKDLLHEVRFMTEGFRSKHIYELGWLIQGPAPNGNVCSCSSFILIMLQLFIKAERAKCL